jgi:hypothetical protein
MIERTRNIVALVQRIYLRGGRRLSGQLFKLARPSMIMDKVRGKPSPLTWLQAAVNL